MPVLIVAPSIVRYSLKGHVAGGHNIVNNVDISLEAPPTKTRSDALSDFHGKLVGFWQDRMVSSMPSVYTFDGAHFVDLNTADGSTGDIAPNPAKPIVGPSGAAATSPQICFLVHLNSSSKRGQRQGRMYFGPIQESQVDGGGVISPSVQTGLQAVVENFRNDIGTYSSLSVESAAWRTVHVHKPDGTKDDPSTWTYSSSTIDNVAVDSQCATQRRRNR